jgi:hypothetical protein
MFITVVISGTVISVAWVEKDKPKNERYVPLASFDGFALCPDCRHPRRSRSLPSRHPHRGVPYEQQSS